MGDDPQGNSTRPRADPPARPRVHQANGTSTWASVAVVVGLLLMVGSIIPSLLAHGSGAPIVLGDAEVIPVTGMVILVLGFLVLLQEWSGLS